MSNQKVCNIVMRSQNIFEPSCLQSSEDNQFNLCDLSSVQENSSINILWSCKQFGNIFLIQKSVLQNKYQNISNDQSEISEKSTKNLLLFEQPFILCQSILICFSMLIYYQLVSLEMITQQNFSQPYNGNSSSEDLSKLERKEALRFYPGDMIIFKVTFKYIHQYMTVFYCDDEILKKSYRFLQFFTELSYLIPMATSFINLQSDETFLKMVFLINFLIILLIRIILKVFQAAYRFGGKLAIFIVFILIICLQLLSYIFLIQALLNSAENSIQINTQIGLILGGTSILTYFIYNPITIYIRIALYKKIISSIKSKKQIIKSTTSFYLFFHLTLQVR